MNRRKFILNLSAASFLLATHKSSSSVFGNTWLSNKNTTFEKIINKAQTEKWNKQSIGVLMGIIGLDFIGKPYVGGTLDIYDTEQCIVNLDELDCVTFFESVFALARIIKAGNYSYDALIEAVTQTRYKEGIIDGYTSRLHYTSQWILQNSNNALVRDITKEIGGTAINFKLGFMSANPKYYKQLSAAPDLIGEIQAIENKIANHKFYYIPKNKVQSIEPLLHTGDIIAIVTNKKGLDYSHTGIIFRKDSVARFMHASLKQKKVMLDSSISEYLTNSTKSNIGITVLRPVEPMND